MPSDRYDLTPVVGTEITDLRGEVWTLVSRDGSSLTYGRQAQRGWYEQEGNVCQFPRYTWDRCVTCGRPATRYVKFQPRFDCCPRPKMVTP